MRRYVSRRGAGERTGLAGGVITSALVVCTRRIGDVLLATPIVRSLKAAYPQAAVDMLVFSGTESIVEAIPDLRTVWTVSPVSTLRESVRLVRSLWRRYDVALSVLPGDRPTFYARIAGRYAAGVLVPDAKSWWKRLLLDGWEPFDNLKTHTVAMNMQLLRSLGIKPLPSPLVTWSQDDEATVRRDWPMLDGKQAYAVLHVSPKFPYKAWNASGWAALGTWLMECGLRVVVAGGASAGELLAAQHIVELMPVGAIDLSGRTSLRQLACVLNRASLYIGTDTAVTHMAAALDVPTVALFGPSNPVKWGPWPGNWPAGSVSPWRNVGSQRQGNVYVLQGSGDCVPCMHEGCDRHVASISECLQQLPAARVIEAAALMLERKRANLSQINVREETRGVR